MVRPPMVPRATTVHFVGALRTASRRCWVRAFGVDDMSQVFYRLSGACGTGLPSRRARLVLWARPLAPRPPLVAGVRVPGAGGTAPGTVVEWVVRARVPRCFTRG